MRFILLLTTIFLFSCVNKKEKIANMQQAIQKEMEQVKASYFKKADSLQSTNKADTNSTKLNEELSLAEGEKNVALLKLQKEYDSLERKLKKY